MAAILKPSGVSHCDGMSLISWKLGRCLVGDAMSFNNLSPSHIAVTSSRPDTVASSAEMTIRRKSSYHPP